jgi:hypothetical protein
MTRKTFEVFDSLTAGQGIAPSDLDDLLKGRVPEDLYLEYKHGNVMDDRRTANETFRQYMSGFANSAGGVLIIGVDQNTWSVTGCSAPGGGALEEWASRSLTKIAHLFSPPPDFTSLKTSEGSVLVAWTARSFSLVHYAERNREPVYYFRIGDQTLEAPEYLITDIVLGRRQRPYLRVTDFRLEQLGHERPAKDDEGLNVLFRPSFEVQNESFFWAENVRLGIIGWVQRHGQDKLGSHLRSHLDVGELDEQIPLDHYSVNLIHDTGARSGVLLELSELAPFRVHQMHADRFVISVRHFRLRYRYIWKAAVYLMSRKSAPIWHQLSLKVDENLSQHIASGLDSLDSESNLLELKRLSGVRPIVAWENFQRY